MSDKSKTTARAPLTESELNCRTHQIFIEETAARLRRERLLKEITGLSRHDFYTWDRRATVTGAQAAKIEGLRTQMTQMKRGYEKKIAKLQKRVDALEALQHVKA